MQLRFAVLAIAAVLTCADVPAIACPLETVSPLAAQLTFGTQFPTDIQDDDIVPLQIRQQAAALAHTGPETTAFSADVEDESISSHIRELADTARREITARMEAIDNASDISELRSFLIDVEDESLSSYFRELTDARSSSNSALQAVAVRADREIGLAAPTSWSNQDEFAGAEEQDATGSTFAVPLTESAGGNRGAWRPSGTARLVVLIDVNLSTTMIMDLTRLRRKRARCAFS